MKQGNKQITWKIVKIKHRSLIISQDCNPREYRGKTIFHKCNTIEQCFSTVFASRAANLHKYINIWRHP